jgi:hypothetical protein
VNTLVFPKTAQSASKAAERVGQHGRQGGASLVGGERELSNGSDRKYLIVAQVHCFLLQLLLHTKSYQERKTCYQHAKSSGVDTTLSEEFLSRFMEGGLLAKIADVVKQPGEAQRISSRRSATGASSKVLTRSPGATCREPFGTRRPRLPSVRSAASSAPHQT